MSSEEDNRQRALNNIVDPVRIWCGDANSQEPSLHYLNGLWHESIMMQRKGTLFTLNNLSLSPLLLPERALQVSVAHAHPGQPKVAEQYARLHSARAEQLKGTEQEHIITMGSLQYMRAIIAARNAESAIMVDVFDHLSELSGRSGTEVRFVQEVPLSTTHADMRFMQYDQDGDSVMAVSVREPASERTHAVNSIMVNSLWKEYAHVRGVADPAFASVNTFQIMSMLALTEA